MSRQNGPMRTPSPSSTRAFEDHVDVDLDVVADRAPRRGGRSAPDRRSARLARTARARRAAGRRVRAAPAARGRWRLRSRSDRATMHHLGGAEFGRGRGEDVGEVVLALRVVVAQVLRASRAAPSPSATMMPVLTSADRALLARRRPCARRSRPTRPCGVAHDAAVAGRDRQFGREHREAAGCCQQAPQRLRRDQRHIAVQHEHARVRRGRPASPAAPRARCRVAAPARSSCRSVCVGEGGLHLLAAVAVHDVDAVGAQRARGIDHVRQHRLARRSAAAPWAVADFMRLPSPAARMTTCSGSCGHLVRLLRRQRFDGILSGGRC